MEPGVTQRNWGLRRFGPYWRYSRPRPTSTMPASRTQRTPSTMPANGSGTDISATAAGTTPSNPTAATAKARPAMVKPSAVRRGRIRPSRCGSL